MRQRRALFAGLLAVVVLTVFAVPAFADDTSGAPPAPDSTTTPVDSTVPDTTAVEEAPVEEAPVEEAPSEEAPAEEAAVEEIAPAAVDVTSEPTDSSSDGDSAPETSSRERETLELLYEAIRRLPPLDRSLILLQLDGVSYGEMAAIHGLNEGTVGARLTRLKQKLSDAMKEVSDELR